MLLDDRFLGVGNFLSESEFEDVQDVNLQYYFLTLLCYTLMIC